MAQPASRRGGHTFVTIPTQLLKGLPQPGGHRRLILYGLIHAHGNGSAQGCFASIGTLARESGFSDRTVKRALAELLELGWITCERRPGTSNRYRTNPAPWPAATRASTAPPPGPTQHHHPGHEHTTTQAISAPSPVPAAHHHRGQQSTPNQIPLTRPPQPEPSNQILSSPSRSPLSVSSSAADAADTQGLEPGQREQPALPPPPRAERLPMPLSTLPPPLQAVAVQIERYWLAKGGSRSRQAFQAMVEELLPVAARAGQQGVSQLLRQATQAGWPTLNGQAWLAQHREELALAKHPAYQVFRAS
jgi:hypothetical protein